MKTIVSKKTHIVVMKRSFWMSYSWRPLSSGTSKNLRKLVSFFLCTKHQKLNELVFRKYIHLVDFLEPHQTFFECSVIKFLFHARDCMFLGLQNFLVYTHLHGHKVNKMEYENMCIMFYAMQYLHWIKIKSLQTFAIS